MNTTVRVAIYSRVSTRDKGQDVENQLRQLRDFCSKHEGWSITHEYQDHVSGKTGDREQFQRMFQDASQRRFDVILFWALDRFSREGALETLQHLKRLTDYGVGWRSFTEQYLDSTGVFRDGVISILAVIARQERIRLSERVVAGLERARAQGRVGGRPRIVCDRNKVLAMRRGGMSLGAIAIKLSLTKSTVHNIVSNG